MKQTSKQVLVISALVVGLIVSIPILADFVHKINIQMFDTVFGICDTEIAQAEVDGDLKKKQGYEEFKTSLKSEITMPGEEYTIENMYVTSQDTLYSSKDKLTLVVKDKDNNEIVVEVTESNNEYKNLLKCSVEDTLLCTSYNRLSPTK